MEKEELEMRRHSMAHILAKALKEIYGDGLKLTIGPAIDNGFYYDVDFESSISPDDFEKIENKMKEIIKRQEDFTRKEISKSEALEMFKDNQYKVEIIKDLADDEVISVYYTGNDFVDLCRGPHVSNSKFLSGFSFKIDKVAGAYWRGSEKNKMLQRIYVLGFENKNDLKEYLKQVEEAKLRDHRKIGKDLGIFMISDVVGKGLPFWLPNGFILRRTIEDYIIKKELSLGYQHVLTPCIGSKELYLTSGHWAHYQDDMFPAMERDGETYVLRPMNCPHHMTIYKNFMHSYKDLPIRIAESGNIFRFEDSGSLTGLERVRWIVQNDSHIFCRPDQIEQEVNNVIDLIFDVYKDFGIGQNMEVRLSLRDKNNKEKYFENDDLWEKSENAFRTILNKKGVKYYEAPGEAAFYGPKIDIQIKTAVGHDVTLPTVQLDYQLPEKFELEYINENSQKVRPVVIHRAILGSFDRFIAYLLEETKGVLPTWLAPKQVVVIPVNENCYDYAKEINEKFLLNDIRSEADLRNESLSYRIRACVTQKIPYIIIIGEKELENKTISVRKRGGKDTVEMSVDDFVSEIKTEIKLKK